MPAGPLRLHVYGAAETRLESFTTLIFMSRMSCAHQLHTLTTAKNLVESRHGLGGNRGAGERHEPERGGGGGRGALCTDGTRDCSAQWGPAFGAGKGGHATECEARGNPPFWRGSREPLLVSGGAGTDLGRCLGRGWHRGARRRPPRAPLFGCGQPEQWGSVYALLPSAGHLAGTGEERQLLDSF